MSGLSNYTDSLVYLGAAGMEVGFICLLLFNMAAIIKDFTFMWVPPDSLSERNQIGKIVKPDF